MDSLVSAPDPLLLTGYRARPGVYDEMVGADGEIRPHWRYLAEALGTLGLPALHDRWREARRLLRESGATYNVYGDPQRPERPLQLDPIPVLVSSDEWREIAWGLVQRAELLNLILRDIYGPQDLIKKGFLPLELVYAHGGFLRPCQPLRTPGPHSLILYAADVARGPDGRVRVLSDRTQAPSGAGYALQNRIVMSRVLPSLYRDSHVHRLSLFFQNLRASLAAISPRRHVEPRVVLLTPGPLNEAYFEHTYLASYLGYTLARGTDLTVRDGQVWLRAVRRLEPVDVILRRVDDHYCDPLELYPDSRLGIPGLTEAVRRGTVAVANPLDASVLENPALNAFLPAIAKHFFGGELQLQSVPTWWCGDPAGREHVLANIDRLVVRSIYRQPRSLPILGGLLSRAEQRVLAERIRARPQWYVGQEQLRPSSVPAVVDSGFEGRQALIRTFLVARERARHHRVSSRGYSNALIEKPSGPGEHFSASRACRPIETVLKRVRRGQMRSITTTHPSRSARSTARAASSAVKATSISPINSLPWARLAPPAMARQATGLDHDRQRIGHPTVRPGPRKRAA
jgi:uncharacterized circularly permuted ATP-grasp superfamily protein